MKLSIGRIKDKLIFIAGIFALLPVVSFKARMFSWIAIIIYILVEIMFIKNHGIKKESRFAIMSVLGLVSTILCVTSDMGDTWKTNAINCYKNFAIITIFMLLNGNGSLTNKELDNYSKGLRISCMIQIVWCYLQFGLFNVAGINITEQIFGDVFNTYRTESVFYSTNRLSVTGLAWHPGQLAPIVVIAYCIFDNMLIKALTIGIALVSLNSSCIIAILCCIALDILLGICQSKKLDIKQLVGAIIAVALLVVVVLSNSGLISLVSERFGTTFLRVANIFNSNKSGYVSNSTYLHIRYYLAYPEIADYLGLLKSLFGVGFDNGGYPYSKILGQYVYLDVWTPESDVINILIGRGWIYFIIFYLWLIRCSIKGYKISKKYTILFISLIISGIGYNNQFEWVIIVECFAYIAIQKKYDILESAIASKNRHKQSYDKLEMEVGDS